MNTIEQQIKTIMERHSMSVPDMAKYLGVPRQTLAKWSTGERNPSAGAKRLIEILVLIDTLAPSIAKTLIEQSKKDKQC